MSGTPPPGVSGYNWLRQSQLKSVINTSGLQLTQLKATDPKQICGRQIDSSVAVGGVGGIPITPDTITPDLIQGHAFVAPTYVANSFTGTAEVDIAGVLHSILTSVEFNNIPMNATKVLWLFKNTLSSTWTPWAETTIPGLPYPAPAQTLSFAYGQVTMGIHYDFGAAYVDLQGNTGVVSAFQTNFNPNNSIFKINSSYLKTFGGTFTPTFLSTPALSSPISANGISASVSMNFTINNQPQDGSLSRVSLWYRVTPSGGPSTSSSTAPYTFYGSVPAVGVGLPLAALPASGTYSFIFTDLTNSNSYDFAVSCEDASGGETRIVYGNTMLPQLIVLPAESLPTHPTNTYITASATSTQVAVSGQSSYYSQLSLSIFVTNGPGGAAIDPSPWLAQIRLLAKPLPVGSTTGDLDIDANDFTVCNAIFTNTITNPIVVTIGPFPANMDQEIAVQLIDQASKTSNADSFLIAMPPGPVYNSSGQLQYVSFGTPIQRIIAPDGTLQPQTVARAQMATPSTGNNLLFNPQGFYGTNYWVQYGGNGSLPPFFGHDNFDGGRFRLYGGLNTLVDWVAEQQLSNLTPGLPMVMSGLLEVDTFNASPGGSVAFEAYDPIADTILTDFRLTGTTPVLTGPVYFEKPFNVPASGTIQIRMHIYNAGSGLIDTYWYKPMLEHGSVATPFNDAMASSAAANTHTPLGTVTVNNGTVTNGQINYNATPSSIQAVINNTSNTYNAAIPTPGSEVPYDAVSGVYQVAIGTNSQLESFQVVVLATHAVSGSGTFTVTPSGISAFLALSGFQSLSAGTWLFMIDFAANVVAAQMQVSVGTFISEIPSATLPSGFTSNVNCNVYNVEYTGSNILTASFVCSGNQTINIAAKIFGNTSSSNAAAGVLRMQSVKIA